MWLYAYKGSNPFSCIRKMKSKTKIEKQKQKKTDSQLVGTIELAKKNKEWIGVAGLLSRPNKKLSKVNLSKIDKETGKETIIVPGKVLSVGSLTKKMKISSYQISESALKKIKDSKSEYIPLKKEIKENPKAEKIKIIS
jgi:ribosomal protein L18E